MSTSNIAKQVVSELESMQEQLSTFKSAVVYLTEAKAQINGANRALKESENSFNQRIDELDNILRGVASLQSAAEQITGKIDGIDFPERLHQIEENLKATVHQIEKTRKAFVGEVTDLTREVARVDFKGNFDQLKTVVANSAKSNTKVIDLLDKQDLPGKIIKLQQELQLSLAVGIQNLETSGKKTSSETLKIVEGLNIPIRMDKLDATIMSIQSSIINLSTRTDNLDRDIREQFSKINERITAQDRKRSQNFRIMLIVLLAILFVLVLGLAGPTLYKIIK